MVCVDIPPTIPEWVATAGMAIAALLWTIYQHFQHKDHKIKIADLQLQITKNQTETEVKKQT